MSNLSKNQKSGLKSQLNELYCSSFARGVLIFNGAYSLSLTGIFLLILCKNLRLWSTKKADFF